MKTLFSVISLFLSVHSFSQAKDSSFAAYTGEYIFPAGYAASSANVIVKNKQLVLSSMLCTTLLIRIHEDTFIMPDYEGKINFIRDSTSKKVIKIHCQINSAAIDAEGDIQDFDAVGEKSR